MDDLGVVRWLRDRAQITDLIIRFANAMDRQEWPRLRTCLTPELDIDYSDLRGDPPGRVTADDFVAARVRGLTGLRTQHLSTNFEITIDGDRAECVSSFLIHRLDPAGPRDANTFDTAGHYRHGLRRTPQGWRIDRIEQRVLWSRGEPRVHGALRGPER